MRSAPECEAPRLSATLRRYEGSSVLTIRWSAGRTTLADVYRAWGCIRPAQVQPRTWQSDQSAWTTHIQPRFGRVPVGSINTLAVQDFAADLRTTHALGTVQRVIASLIALMEFALDHHYIEINPARIRLNLHRDAHPHYVTLDPGELMAAWALQRKDSRHADMALFLALTGLHWADFTALRPLDIVTAPHGDQGPHLAQHRARPRRRPTPRNVHQDRRRPHCPPAQARRRHRRPRVPP